MKHVIMFSGQSITTRRRRSAVPSNKSALLPVSALVAGICVLSVVVQQLSAQSPPTIKGYFTTLPVTAGPIHSAVGPIITVTPLPTFNYSIVASAQRGGATYTGSIMGRSPYSHGKTTTSIPTQIIPLVITINDGTTTVTYDPTQPDACVTGNPTDVSIITGSPIFANTAWTMNGQGMGTTQYIDAFQRSQFWSLVQGTPYHLILSQSTLASQALSFDSSQGTNYSAAALIAGKCGNIGVVNINTLDAAVRAIITGPLAGSINVGTFPIFLTKNVVSAEAGHSIFANCCVLGYHSAFTVGSNLQVYSPFSLDTTGIFGGDVSTLSHEMGEAVNDPSTNNATPAWGFIGQVQGGCQANFETGDPLSPGFPPPVSNSFVVTIGTFTYHLQEMAQFSWFFGAPNLGISPKYSNNGTFGGEAKSPCPPGGTN